MEEQNNNHLRRSMTTGQMEMIAIGGTIGSGLFMGATSTIKWAGPSVLLAYAVVGLVLYAMMRALGEMIYLNPGTGSFADYGTKYINPLSGYLVKWSNVFQFIIVGISDVIAMSQYLNYWWPNLPDWLSGIILIVILTLANLVSAKAYGSLEFWFAMVKVVTIILMIVVGLMVIVFGLGNNWHPVGLSNLWSHGGFFPNGWKGFFFSLAVIAGSYQGIELLGIAAGETASPQKAIVTQQLPLFIQRDRQADCGGHQKPVHGLGAGLVIGVGHAEAAQKHDDEDTAHQKGIEQRLAGLAVDPDARGVGRQRGQHAPAAALLQKFSHFCAPFRPRISARPCP